MELVQTFFRGRDFFFKKRNKNPARDKPKKTKFGFDWFRSSKRQVKTQLQIEHDRRQGQAVRRRRRRKGSVLRLSLALSLYLSLLPSYDAPRTMKMQTRTTNLGRCRLSDRKLSERVS